MTQPNRISWLAVCAAIAAFVFTPGYLSAQNFVTPTIAPTPGIGVPGQFIVVDNTPGLSHLEPHVSGDLVCYTNSGEPTSAVLTVQYFNLDTKSAGAIPPPANTPYLDFFCNVRGSVLTFTRVTAGNTTAVAGQSSTIMTFDTSAGGQPMPISPATAFANESAIGDATIVWEQIGANGFGGDIFAYDRSTGMNEQISPSSISSIAGLQNTQPRISPDGTVVVWQSQSASADDIWKAILVNGIWTAQQVQSQFGPPTDGVFAPATDGNIIAYSSDFVLNGVRQDSVTWQLANPAEGGQVTEQVLGTGTSINPSISAGYMAFDIELSGNAFHDLAVYDVTNNVLYNVTADLAAAGLIPPSLEQELDDISVTPDGKVRVVWQQGSGNAIYAYTFFLGSNLAIQMTAPPTAPAGSNIPYTIRVTNNGPQDAASVMVSDALPPGMTFVSCAPSTGTCTEGTSSGTFTVTINFGSLAAGASATATLVLAAPSGLPAGTTEVNTVTVSTTGLNTNPNNAASASVTLTASTASIANTIGQLLSAGCIDNAGVANALTSKLATAQGFLNAGDNLDAINALSALLNQIRAQAGKHIATSCTINGQTFNPTTLLITDVQSLIDSLRVGMIADPITGYVTNSSGVGLPGAVISLLDSNGNTLATATTDITGFYYFATTGVLSSNSNYIIAVTGPPAGFTTSTPASQPLTWQGTGLAFSFALN